MAAVLARLWYRLSDPSGAVWLLAAHVALSFLADLWDLVVLDGGLGLLGASLLIEAFFVWRVWMRGRVAWWVAAIGQGLAIGVLAVAMADPESAGYPPRLDALAFLPVVLLTLVGLMIWLSPGLRGHVFGPAAPAPIPSTE